MSQRVSDIQGKTMIGLGSANKWGNLHLLEDSKKYFVEEKGMDILHYF